MRTRPLVTRMFLSATETPASRSNRRISTRYGSRCPLSMMALAFNPSEMTIWAFGILAPQESRSLKIAASDAGSNISPVGG